MALSVSSIISLRGTLPCGTFISNIIALSGKQYLIDTSQIQDLAFDSFESKAKTIPPSCEIAKICFLTVISYG